MTHAHTGGLNTGENVQSFYLIVSTGKQNKRLWMCVPSVKAQPELQCSAVLHPSCGGQQRGPSVSGGRTPSSEEEPAKSKAQRLHIGKAGAENEVLCGDILECVCG